MANINLNSPTFKRDYQEWLRFCERVQASTIVAKSESPSEQSKRKSRALRDYNFYVKTYFPIYADSDCAYFHIEGAEAALKDPNFLGIFEWPREHAKSVHANILIPMWLMAHGEVSGMLLMGKNEDDACNLLSDLQAQLQHNALYAHDWGNHFNYGDWQEGDFTTKNGIRFRALGREQSPRGSRKGEKRPNLLVIDDIDDDEIVNNQRRVKEIVKRIFGATYFALAIKGARMIVAGNRIHSQSILAHIVGDIKPSAPKREGIYHSKVYATQNERREKCYISQGGKPAWPRYSIEELQTKITKGGIYAKTEFYHETTVDGDIFKDHLIVFKKLPRLQDYKVIIGYFDPSFENKPTSDFKACRVWGLKNGEFHCIDCIVQKTELTTVFAWMCAFEDSLPPGVGVIWYMEKQFFNRPTQDALFEVNKGRIAAGKRILNVTIDNRVKENKYTRIVKMEPMYSLRKVYYNLDKMHDPDMQEGNNQLKGIEPGYHSADDSPDADEGAWYYLSQHLTEREFRPKIGRDKKSAW